MKGVNWTVYFTVDTGLLRQELGLLCSLFPRLRRLLINVGRTTGMTTFLSNSKFAKAMCITPTRAALLKIPGGAVRGICGRCIPVKERTLAKTSPCDL